jgi:hypothetical protein
MYLLTLLLFPRRRRRRFIPTYLISLTIHSLRPLLHLIWQLCPIPVLLLFHILQPL